MAFHQNHEPAPAKLALSIPEVLNRVPIKRTRLYEELRTGKLPHRKCGARTLVLAAEVCRYKDYSRRAAYRDIEDTISENIRNSDATTPLPGGLPVAELKRGGGTIEGKLRGAGDRVAARREIAAKLYDMPIARRLYEMLGSGKRDD